MNTKHQPSAVARWLGPVFIALSIYQLVQKDHLEFSLYAVAGLAFIINTLSFEPKLRRYRRPLIIFTWILIIAAALLFFYILQFKDFS